MRHTRLVLTALPIATLAAIGSIACSSANEQSSGSSADIVGGAQSQDQAFVAVADAADRFACTGVLVRKDVVLIPSGCSAVAAAVYIGFSNAVPSDAALGPLAGGARRIALSGPRGSLGAVAGLQIMVAALVEPAATEMALETTTPAVGDHCTVIGHGTPTYGAPDGGSVGEQRTANVKIASQEWWQGFVYSPNEIVNARGIDGSVSEQDQNAFLVCAGKLVGPKVGHVADGFGDAGAPTEVRNEVAFANLAYGHVNANLVMDQLSQLDDAGAIDQDAGAIDPCQSANACTPGQVETTDAACLQAGKHRTRTCKNDCTWSNFTATCQ
jgi:hypothetical protein